MRKLKNNLKNIKPRRLSDTEIILRVAKRILKKHEKAFKELAK